MTIKYECDNCGQEVYGPEAIGEGVVVYQGDHAHMGKAYVFEDVDTPITLNISITTRVNPSVADHFCLACMWKALERMMDRYAPRTVEIDDLSKFKPEGWAADGKIGTFHVKESNEETPATATEPDNELPELYAEGVLPTPGADERADEPDDPGPSQPSLGGFEDRPGWQYRSTANGI